MANRYRILTVVRLKLPRQLNVLALLALATQPMGNPVLASTKQIYRCPQLNAPPLFSGTPCISTHQLMPVITSGTITKEINGYAPTPLTKTERRQLQLLKQKTDRQSNNPQSNNPQSNNPQRNNRQKNKRASNSGYAKPTTAAPGSACARHQEALRALHNRRRKGYKLSEAARLDQQEQRLKQNVRLHC